mgnify:CR=1 FL=1
MKKEPTILGAKITSHDTGAALISGTRVVAIAEERLCRIKHSTNVFPTLSIDYCLETTLVYSNAGTINTNNQRRD